MSNFVGMPFGIGRCARDDNIKMVLRGKIMAAMKLLNL
jgi:hypothetical protein